MNDIIRNQSQFTTGSLDTDEHRRGEEIRLIDIVDMLWRGKWWIMLATILSLVAGAALYFAVPRSFQSEVEIRQISQPAFARFLGLAGAEIFPYTPETLLSEFSSYLRDADHLMEAARSSGVIAAEGLNEDQYRLALRRFVGSVEFETRHEESEENYDFLRMRVRDDESAALYAFVETAVRQAGRDLLEGISAEVGQRITTEREQRLAELEQVRLGIEARRERREKERTDRIEWLLVNAKIARSVGLAKPAELEVLNRNDPGASAQIYSAPQNQPEYLRGYLAIEQEIEILRQRTDNDPFIADLRELQQQVYTLENDPRPFRLRRLLQQSGLSEPDATRLVAYSVAAATPVRIFPQLIVFGAGALLFGLAVGCGLVLLRGAYARR